MARSTRYRTASSWEDSLRAHGPSCTVWETDRPDRFSGLLDATGNKIMVVEQRETIGFVAFQRQDA